MNDAFVSLTDGSWLNDVRIMSETPTEWIENGAGSIELPTGDRHRLLASARRRLALEILAERTTPLDLEELAAKIAAREDGADEATPERVAVSLHHVHLPMMAALGVVEYDPGTHRIDPAVGMRHS